jgi:hypothetical protein
MPGKVRKPQVKSSSKTKLYCPYCDEIIAKASFPHCEACKILVFYCPKCHQPTSRENYKCPNCGADIIKAILDRPV